MGKVDDLTKALANANIDDQLPSMGIRCLVQTLPKALTSPEIESVNFGPPARHDSRSK